MSKFDRIPLFISIVEENGFAKAARKKQISTAAISRQMAALESELGVQLIQRTTRQMKLTEVGVDYYQRCKKALTELQEAESAIIGSQHEATGILNVTSNRYFALTYLVPTLAKFMQQNPKLRIKLELAERFPDLAEENVDILFGVSWEGPAELVRKRVAMTRYVLCASPRYLQQYGTPQTPEELMQHQYITHSMRTSNNVIQFKDGKEVYVEPLLYLNDSYTMRECAIRDMGIVKLHDHIVTDALEDGRLIEILVAYIEPEQAVYLYYQQSRYLQPKIRRFIDFYTRDPQKLLLT
ncbi:LysR family transcriptional regulator [soil metagenome]